MALDDQHNFSILICVILPRIFAISIFAQKALCVASVCTYIYVCLSVFAVIHNFENDLILT
jgi:hypothetical protein